MNPSDLKRGKEYNYLDPVANQNKTVFYCYEQINYFVFRGDGTSYYLPHSRVQSNITNANIIDVK